jgi:hypothetical protein
MPVPLDFGDPLPLHRPLGPNRKCATALHRRRYRADVAVLAWQPHVVIHVPPYDWGVALAVPVHRGRHAWSRPFHGAGRLRKGVRVQLDLLSEVCATPRPYECHPDSTRDGCAIFLLHEIFDFDYAEVARIVGKTQVNCRQIVNHANVFIIADPDKLTPPEQPRPTRAKHKKGHVTETTISAMQNTIAK